MTTLTIRSGNTISNLEYGLADIGEPTRNGMRRSSINKAVSHMVNFLNEETVRQGITGVDIKTGFPELPRDDVNKLVSNVKAPAILVTVRLGTTKSTAGQFFADTMDGEARYFNQTAYYEFDCFGINSLTADQLSGWVGEEIQKNKAYVLSLLGFQDFQTVYSAPQHGFDYRLQWDFKEYYYKLKILRHLLYVRTSFDVVWVIKKISHGKIYQVVFEDTSEFDINMDVGYNLSHIYAEEQFLNWHNVIA